MGHPLLHNMQVMDNDPAREWMRLQEQYRQMDQDELENAAKQAYELTETAQQALAMEIKNRALDFPLCLERPAKPKRLAMHTENEFLNLSVYNVYVAFSEAEARQATHTLDEAGIAWTFGPDNRDQVEGYSGSYKDGVAVRVLGWDWNRARAILPQQNLPEPEDYPEGAVTCPNCRSEDVVLDATEEKAADGVPGKFSWHCETCGHEWQDDGVEKLV